MLTPLPVDIGPHAPLDATTSTHALKKGEQPLADFDAAVEAALEAEAGGVGGAAEESAPVPTDGPEGSLLTDGLLHQEEMTSLAADGSEDDGTPLVLPTVGAGSEGQAVPAHTDSLVSDVATGSESALTVEGAQPSTTLVGEGAAEVEVDVFVAQAELGRSVEVHEEFVASERLMPLIGGDGTVDSSAGQLSTEGDPRMTQPLQDAHLLASQSGRQPVSVDPLGALTVQQLLDSGAIEAKEGLRQEAIAGLRELRSPDQGRSADMQSTAPVVSAAQEGLMAQGAPGQGATAEVIKPSAPWLGLAAPQEIVPQPLESAEPLPAIEHALLAVDNSDVMAEHVAALRSTPFLQPQVGIEQQAPWARSLIGSHVPTVLSEVAPGESVPQADVEEVPEVLLDDASGGRRPAGYSMAEGLGPRPMGEASPLNSGLSDVSQPATAASAEPDAAKTARVARTLSPGQVMTPEMAMAADDVAEFSVVQPDRMDLKIQDAQGDLEISVAREEEGLAVKVKAPSEIIEDFQNMESDVEAALAEDEQELASYDAESNDEEQNSNGSESSEEGGTEATSSTGLGARVLSRIA